MLLTSLLVVVASFVVSASATTTEDVVQAPTGYFLPAAANPNNSPWYRWYDEDWGWAHTFNPANKVLISASLEIYAYDVDSGATDPEVDVISADGTNLGNLAGASGTWSTNTFSVPVSLLADGTLNVWMDIDSTHSSYAWAVTLEYSKLTVVWDLLAVVDIKPWSCPNAFNRGARGVLPVAIYGTDYFDVYAVDPASVELGEIAPLRWSFEDVNMDGMMDLALKFSLPEVAALGAVAAADVHDYVALTLTGELMDGTTFQGTDWLWIIM